MGLVHRAAVDVPRLGFTYRAVASERWFVFRSIAGSGHSFVGVLLNVPIYWGASLSNGDATVPRSSTSSSVQSVW
jgi:hypothetical protein